MNRISIENMELEEVQSMSAHQQAIALSEVLWEIARVSAEVDGAILAEAEARRDSLLSGDDEAKSRQIIARARLDALQHRLKTLGRYKSILQTLLRMA